MRFMIIAFFFFSFLLPSEELNFVCSNHVWHSDLAQRVSDANDLYNHPVCKAHRETMRVYINNMPPETAYVLEVAWNNEGVSFEEKESILDSIFRTRGDEQPINSAALNIYETLGDLNLETTQLARTSGCLPDCKIQLDLLDTMRKHTGISLGKFITTAFKAKVWKIKPQE